MGKQKGAAKRCVYCGEPRASVLYNGSSTVRETWIHKACLRKTSANMLERSVPTQGRIQFVVLDTHAAPVEIAEQEEADADGFVEAPGFS